MRKIFLLLAYYAIVHASAGDFAVEYEGMDKATVENLITTTYSASFDFVTVDQYQAFIKAHLKG